MSQRYLVRGTLRETGQQIERVINADSVTMAMREAGRLGIDATAVTKYSNSAPSSPASQSDVKFDEVTPEQLAESRPSLGGHFHIHTSSWVVAALAALASPLIAADIIPDSIILSLIAVKLGAFVGICVGSAIVSLVVYFVAFRSMLAATIAFWITAVSMAVLHYAYVWAD